MTLGLTPSSCIKNTLRGLRDVITARKKDQAVLQDMWEDGFTAFIDLLAFCHVDIIKKDTTAETLHAALKSIGFDVREPFYYNQNSVLAWLAPAMASILVHSRGVGDWRRAQETIERFNSRYSLKLYIPEFTHEVSETLKDIRSRMANSATISGYYHTLRYFAAFSPRFLISKELVERINADLSSRNYNKNTILRIYKELEESYHRDLLPSQRGLFELFTLCNREMDGADYTHIFG